MELHTKWFNALSIEELYSIIKLRVDVFVVEQNCPYSDLDGRDQAAVHLWLQDEEGIQAYLRVMDRGVEGEHVSIGRVISLKRREGVGSLLLRHGIAAAREYFGADKIYLEAQQWAKPFYARQGFRQISDPFILDGIPHIKMLLEDL